MTKVGKSDREGTFAGRAGNDGNALIPDTDRVGAPEWLDNVADFRRDEHIASDVPIPDMDATRNQSVAVAE